MAEFCEAPVLTPMFFYPRLVPVVVVAALIVIIAPVLIATPTVVDAVLFVVTVAVVSAIIALLVSLPVRLPILIVIAEPGLVPTVSVLVVGIGGRSRAPAGLPIVHALR